MSRSHTGVALSIAAHAIAGAIIAGWVATSPRRVTGALDREPETIEIEVFVEPAAPTAAIVSPAPRAEVPTTRAPRRERVTRTTAITEIAPPPSEATPTAPTPRVRALPSAPSIENTTDPTPTSKPPGTVPTHSTFTMRVDPDGTVRFTDRPNLQVALGMNAVEIEEGRAEQWLDGHHERSNAIEMKLPRAGAVVARFDVTDWAMRSGGQDPYAHEKLKALDATRDARAQVRARHREQQAMGTPALVRATLDEIVALAPAKRAAALLEMWRDCDDSTAGEIARATIVEYVRSHTEFSATDRAALARL